MLVLLQHNTQAQQNTMNTCIHIFLTQKKIHCLFQRGVTETLKSMHRVKDITSQNRLTNYKLQNTCDNQDKKTLHSIVNGHLKFTRLKKQMYIQVIT